MLGVSAADAGEGAVEAADPGLASESEARRPVRRAPARSEIVIRLPCRMEVSRAVRARRAAD